MTQAALGLKRKCESCGGLFFDLLHSPIVCPRCQAVFTPPPPLPQRPAYKQRPLDHVAPPIQAAEPEAPAAEEADELIEDSDEEQPEAAVEDDAEPASDESET